MKNEIRAVLYLCAVLSFSSATRSCDSGWSEDELGIVSNKEVTRTMTDQIKSYMLRYGGRTALAAAHAECIAALNSDRAFVDMPTATPLADCASSCMCPNCNSLQVNTEITISVGILTTPFSTNTSGRLTLKDYITRNDKFTFSVKELEIMEKTYEENEECDTALILKRLRREQTIKLRQLSKKETTAASTGFCANQTSRRERDAMLCKQLWLHSTQKNCDSEYLRKLAAKLYGDLQG